MLDHGGFSIQVRLAELGSVPMTSFGQHFHHGIFCDLGLHSYSHSAPEATFRSPLETAYTEMQSCARATDDSCENGTVVPNPSNRWESYSRKQLSVDSRTRSHVPDEKGPES
ncbi:hypothetical protein NPIL_183111 [Nephila pilipes]|uniref:Uncharacterized protein n=1 Tax=Nephila pilipes TaxID=299642 RepID=A0A8X6PYE0_NEPPI|nr:hypothetical protein NPIL_183111 [Nephila pilipes]